MKTLSELKEFCAYRGSVDGAAQIDDLQTDSRKAGPKTVFVALRGTRVNGLDYALKAQEAGAAAVIVPEDNRPSLELLEKLRVPVFVLPKKKALSELADWFYDSPSQRLGLIGVTGTNGKSTTVELIAQWLTRLNRKCAVLGTLGVGFLPDLEKTANTTLDAISLQRTLHNLLAKGARYAAMEVSSIGAAEGRVDNCRFVAGGYTNLTRDHLDYHGTMENYADAKARFLSMVTLGHLAVNIDNSQGLKYASTFPHSVLYSRQQNAKAQLMSYACDGWLWVKHVDYRRNGLHLEIDSSYGQGECTMQLLGSFNVENIACALAVLLSMQVPLSDLMHVAKDLKPVCGRMERFTAPDKPAIVVDYAHTPDGVEQVLKATREHHSDGQIWCVLGCGGNRDRGKRPMMAIKASVYADHAVLTSDNPRRENPERILDDMMRGVEQAHNVKRITDREEAIHYAFEHAGANDVVVIAGKGHEDYQILGDKTIHYSDREEAAALLGIHLD